MQGRRHLNIALGSSSPGSDFDFPIAVGSQISIYLDHFLIQFNFKSKLPAFKV